jgi:hypothetical protein
MTLKRILAIALLCLPALAFAQPQTVTTTATQTITGAKTFSGTCKLLLAGSTSGTTCLQAPAIAGSTTAIVFPSSAGTLALSGANVAYTQLTGLGSGVATWLGTPTGANLVSALSSGGGTSNFLRADGTFASPAGGSGLGDVVGPASAVNNGVVFFDGTTGKLIKDSGVTLSGSNTGDQTITLTGDVTGSGTGSFAATIAANAVTNAKAAQMAAHTIKGNNTGSTANAIDLTVTQVTADLNAMVGDSGSGGTKGLVPAPASGDAAKVLSGAGTWVAQSSGLSGLTAGRVLLSATATTGSDDSGLTYDTTNDRLMVGTATTTSGNDLYVKKSVNSQTGAVVENGSNGTAALAGMYAKNDLGTYLSLEKLSSGFTTAGLLLADSGVIRNSGAQLLISTLGAQPIIVSVNGTAAANEAFRILGAAGAGSAAGNIGIGAAGGVTNPTAYLHIKAGTATAGTAPLKLTSGTLNATSEPGAIEFLTDKYYATITTGLLRAELALWNAAGTSGRIPVETTNGRLADSAGLTYDLANDRMMMGTATTTSGNDFFLKKTVNGQVGMFVANGSTGTAGYTIFGVSNSADNLDLLKISTGYTPSGLYTADAGVVQNDAGNLVLMNVAATPIIFATGGTAAANERLRADTTGVVVMNALAIPAGGTAATGLRFSSTANFGVFFGSGAPTLSAAKGSLYLRSDGSGTGDRIYVNTNGSTTWTAITTAS